MIDRGDIRQAIDRCSNIWASLPGAGYSQFDTGLTTWLQNSKKRAERSERLMYMVESPRLSPLWLSASSSACHGLIIITVITPLPTKPSATKMPENWSWRTRQLLTCRCVSVMLLRSMQNTQKELADAKAENDALRDDVALVVVSCTSKQSSNWLHGEATTASGVDNAASPDWQPLSWLFHPQRGWSLCKNNWKEPKKYINEQCR